MQTHKKDIGGYPVAVTVFPALKGFALGAHLSKLIAPAAAPLMAEGMKQAKAGGLLAEAFVEVVAQNPLAATAFIDFDKVAPALQTLAAQIEPDAFAKLAADLLSSTTITMPLAGSSTVSMVELGREGMIDLVFSGRLRLMLEVLFFVVQVNFLGFFSDAITRGGKSPGSETPKPNP